MNSFLLIQLISLLYKRNQLIQSLLILDCGENIQNVNLYRSSDHNIKISSIILNFKVNVNEIINLFLRNSQDSEQIGVLMNYNCKRSAEILQLVRRNIL